MTKRLASHDIPPMSAEEYRTTCEALGWSPTYAAPRKLGISARMAHYYASGEAVVNPTVAALLRTTLELQACQAELARCRAESAGRK